MLDLIFGPIGVITLYMLLVFSVLDSKQNKK